MSDPFKLARSKLVLLLWYRTSFRTFLRIQTSSWSQFERVRNLTQWECVIIPALPAGLDVRISYIPIELVVGPLFTDSNRFAGMNRTGRRDLLELDVGPRARAGMTSVDKVLRLISLWEPNV